MKKILTILFVFLLPSFVYGDFIDKVGEKIIIEHGIQERKGSFGNLNHITIPRFDTEDVNIKKHEYKLELLYDEKRNLGQFFSINDKPEIVDFLYARFGFERIMKFLQKGASESLIEIMSYDYIKNVADYFFEGDIKKDVKYFMNVEQKIEIENIGNTKIMKMKFYMFDKNTYSDGRGDYFEPRAKLVIVDNALYYRDFYVEMDGKTYNPEVKYIYQKTITDVNEKTITFLPYYEIEISLKKGINQLKTRYDLVDTIGIEDRHFMFETRGLQLRLMSTYGYQYLKIASDEIGVFLKDEYLNLP